MRISDWSSDVCSSDLFGGIIAVNRPLDAATAAAVAALFAEVVIAPAVDDAAEAVLASKKNLRVLVTGGLPDPAAEGILITPLAGGFLAQSRDSGRIDPGALKVVTKRAPSEQELADMVFEIGRAH